MRGQRQKQQSRGSHKAKSDFDFTISRDKWDSLSPKEQELLRDIGAVPEHKRVHCTAAKIPDILAPKPYTLGIKLKCVLCGTIEYKAFSMIEAKGLDGTPVLIPSQLTTAFYPYSDKFEERKMSSCPMCPVVLQKLSKEKIIQKTLICASTTSTWRLERYAGNDTP